VKRPRPTPHLTAQRRLDQIARALRGGASLALALESVDRGVHVEDSDDPVDRLVHRLVAQSRRGVTVADALRHTPCAPRDSGAVAVHRCLTAAADGAITHEGALRIVELGAKLAGDRNAVSEERRAHSAQARLSATVLTWVPAVVALVSIGADRQVRDFTLGTTPGRVCLLMGGLALVTGHRWIRHLVAVP
jgi:Flp pilus assembly protein TadB